MGLTRLLIPRFVGSRAPRALRLIHRLVACGIAVAVAMLIVTVAVMQGFWGSYVAAARQFHGDIVLVHEPESAPPADLLQALHDDGTTAVIESESPFLLREGLLTGGGDVPGVVIKAVAWAEFSRVHPDLRVNWMDGGEAAFAAGTGGLPVILGKAMVGAQLPTHLFMPTPGHPEGESLPLNVVGIFESGLYDYDHQFVFVPRQRLTRLLHLDPDTIGGMELRLRDPSRTWQASQTWQDRFPEATITNWSELNHNMFDALRLQRTTFVVLMSLFVAIAISNIVSVVGLQVFFRRQDGAILRLLGLPLRRLRRLIAMATVWTSVLGTACGAALGLGIILVLRHTSLVALPEKVYFVAALPVQLTWTWTAGIVAGALLVSLIVVWVAVRHLAAIPILKGLWRT